MNIVKTTWKDIKAEVRNNNNELYNVLDQIKHTHRLPLYLIEYNFGDIVAQPDVAFLRPQKNFSKLFRDNLPFSVVIDKKFEMYIELDNRIFSYRIYSKGMPLGTARYLDDILDFEPSDITKLSAGARSTFLLAKASEKIHHNNIITSLGTYIKQPKSLDDHFETFRQIADASNSQWKAKLLCFTKEWENLVLKEKPTRFIEYLRKYNSKFDSYWRTTPYFDFTLTCLNTNESESVNNYVFEIIKRICGIACKQIPGFRPVVDDDFIPYLLIAETYRDLYKIKTAPFVMEPALLNDDDKPVYLSLFRDDIPYKPNRISNSIKLSTDVLRLFKQLVNSIESLDIYKNTAFRKSW